MLFISLMFLFIQTGWTYYENETNVVCIGKRFNNVTLTAYYSDYNVYNERQFYDMNGKKLRSLQDYLDNQCNFITLAMDEKLGIPYRTKVCIPELNEHFGHHLNFEVRDNGTNLKGMGYLRADIYVRSEIDSYDKIVNRKVTLVFEN